MAFYKIQLQSNNGFQQSGKSVDLTILCAGKIFNTIYRKTLFLVPPAWCILLNKEITYLILEFNLS